MTGVTLPHSQYHRYDDNIARRLTAAVELLPTATVCELVRKLGGKCDGLTGGCKKVWTLEKLMSLIHTRQALHLVTQLGTLSEADIVEMMFYISHDRCNTDVLHRCSLSTLRIWLALLLGQVSSKPWCLFPEQLRRLNTLCCAGSHRLCIVNSH
jgi:hypothetical protein